MEGSGDPLDEVKLNWHIWIQKLIMALMTVLIIPEKTILVHGQKVK